ncbi:MAG: type IX secretion system plug protein domain-containing protein [Gracilimonas sp.]
MYFKVFSQFKYVVLFGISILISGCSAGLVNQNNNTNSNQKYISRYLVPGQLPAPSSIKSVQLYRQGNVLSPPIISLNSSQKLVLAFDELSSLNGQFKITFTHHDQEWNNSNIPEDWYLGGMNEIVVGNGVRNKLSEPVYHHYKTEFPSKQLQFKSSGNYMLHVSDFSSGIRLFSLPFFVTEDEGEINSWVETVYNAGPRYGAIDQPFSEFEYPDFIDFPEFDLSFYFAQNRFWGDIKQSKNYDFNEEDYTQFHLSRENAFPANFDFIGLNLDSFSVYGSQIIDWRPDLNPPLVILREDVLNFTSDPITGWNSTFGNPSTSTDARYANVRFRFEDGGQFSKDRGVYLVGDFNQWLLSENHKLKYNRDSGYWETISLIKQGSYTYKYALKDGTNEIDDLLLSDTITRQNQEYVSFVYFQDPEYRYQRLLQVQVFSTNK